MLPTSQDAYSNSIAKLLRACFVAYSQLERNMLDGGVSHRMCLCAMVSRAYGP